MPYEVKRTSIPDWVQNLLWARAAGRCEFRGCNRELWKSLVTQKTANMAEKAHIWSVAEGGPRGRKGISAQKIDDVENLMLLCHDSHEEIDAKRNESIYSASVLLAMKQEHEQRVECVTGIDPSHKSHVLLFGANIGDVSSPLRFEAVTPGMLPQRYPTTKHAIELGISNSATRDRDADFWQVEVSNLSRLFDRRVGERLSTGDIDHISVFARAPQPLLTALGVMLTDIVAADIYPLRREPPGFRFEDDAPAIELEVHEPTHADGSPALVFSISATVVAPRIEAVVGNGAAIWHVTVPAPHNDIVRSREHLATFRRRVRPLLDRIKAVHGEDTILHVFPAIPIPLAVELGRVRMPKADMPWRIYDEIPGAGFVPAIDVRGGSVAAAAAKEQAA